jgi:hypothetical protein
MNLPVIISETAMETFDAIRDQILERLGAKAAKDFCNSTCGSISPKTPAYNIIKHPGNQEGTCGQKVSAPEFVLRGY